MLRNAVKRSAAGRCEMKIKHIHGVTVISNEVTKEITIRQQPRGIHKGQIMPFEELEKKICKSIEIITPGERETRT